MKIPRDISRNRATWLNTCVVNIIVECVQVGWRRQMNRRNDDDGDDVKGFLWKLPAVKSKQLGKLGPAFGIGAGCGFGFAVGLIGGLHRTSYSYESFYLCSREYTYYSDQYTCTYMADSCFLMPDWGTGFGPGIPGFQFGFGFGAGCGVGLGFGYGLGRGIAYDENRRHSNVGRIFHNRGNVPVQ